MENQKAIVYILTIVWNAVLIIRCVLVAWTTIQYVVAIANIASMQYMIMITISMMVGLLGVNGRGVWSEEKVGRIHRCL
jgi:hypothetical protein